MFLVLRVLIVKGKEKEERGSGLWIGGKVCGLKLWEITEKSVIEKVHEKKEGQQVGPVYGNDCHQVWGDMALSPGLILVEGENQLPQVVLWASQACYGICILPE